MGSNPGSGRKCPRLRWYSWARHCTPDCVCHHLIKILIKTFRAKYNNLFFGLKYRRVSVRFLLYKTTARFEISRCYSNAAPHKRAVEAWQCSRQPWLFSNPALCVQPESRALHDCDTQTSLAHTEMILQHVSGVCSSNQQGRGVSYATTLSLNKTSCVSS